MGITVEFLKENNLVLVDKAALMQFVSEQGLVATVDKRVKWIDRKTAKVKYGVSAYWLRKSETAVGSLLKVNPGNTENSKKKYNEQSIINELERQSI